MSDGLLKKEIEELVLPFIHSNIYIQFLIRKKDMKFGDAENIRISQEIFRLNLKRIFDEAKKENPLNPVIGVFDIYKNLNNHTREEKEVLINEYLENCNLKKFLIEIIKWFLKYFGTVARKQTTEVKR